MDTGVLDWEPTEEAASLLCEKGLLGSSSPRAEDGSLEGEAGLSGAPFCSGTVGRCRASAEPARGGMLAGQASRSAVQQGAAVQGCCASSAAAGCVQRFQNFYMATCGLKAPFSGSVEQRSGCRARHVHAKRNAGGWASACRRHGVAVCDAWAQGEHSLERARDLKVRGQGKNAGTRGLLQQRSVHSKDGLAW